MERDRPQMYGYIRSLDLLIVEPRELPVLDIECSIKANDLSFYFAMGYTVTYTLVFSIPAIPTPLMTQTFMPLPN